jgi:hypothetical protein
MASKNAGIIMAIPIDQNWSFEEVVKVAYTRYRGSNIMARDSQYSVIRNWGSVVGRKRAINELNNFIRQNKTKKELQKR